MRPYSLYVVLFPGARHLLVWHTDAREARLRAQAHAGEASLAVSILAPRAAAALARAGVGTLAPLRREAAP